MANTPANPVSIVNVGYRSTNFWVISAGTSRLLLDLGWPGSLDTLRASLTRMNVPLKEIRYGLATHYHIDHAGLAQDLKREGMRLLVVDLQVPWTRLAALCAAVVAAGTVTAWLAGRAAAGKDAVLAVKEDW